MFFFLAVFESNQTFCVCARTQICGFNKEIWINSCSLVLLKGHKVICNYRIANVYSTYLPYKRLWCCQRATFYDLPVFYWQRHKIVSLKKSARVADKHTRTVRRDDIYFLLSILRFHIFLVVFCFIPYENPYKNHKCGNLLFDLFYFLFSIFMFVQKPFF